MLCLSPSPTDFLAGPLFLVGLRKFLCELLVPSTNNASWVVFFLPSFYIEV